MTKHDLYEKLLFALFWVLTFFAPTGIFIALIGFIVAADTITGVLAALRRGEEIRSKKLFRTVSKFISFGIAVLIAHAISLFFFPEFPAVKVVSGYIAFMELKSIDENIYDITGYSLFKPLLDKLKPKR